MSENNENEFSQEQEIQQKKTVLYEKKRTGVFENFKKLLTYGCES